jgi:hypothetical protein
MIKEIRQTLEKMGYTADEIEPLLKSFTEIVDKLSKAPSTIATDTSDSSKMASSVRWPGVAPPQVG